RGVGEEDREEEEITDGTEEGFPFSSGVEEIVDVVGGELGASREEVSDGSGFGGVAGSVSCYTEAEADDSPERVTGARAKRRIHQGDKQTARFKYADDTKRDSQVAVADGCDEMR